MDVTIRRADHGWDHETSPLTHAIIGAAYRVHGELGNGLLEVPYQEAMELELADRGIVAEREKALPIHYRGWKLKTVYRADFFCPPETLVELKAISSLGRVEEAQVVHYLNVTRLRTGLLLNFGSPSLQVRRLTSRPRTPSSPRDAN